MVPVDVVIARVSGAYVERARFPHQNISAKLIGSAMTVEMTDTYTDAM
jgi:hypothetical protein